VLGIFGVVFGALYLLWRALATSTNTNPVLFWALLGAEFVGWLSFALFVRDAWQRDPVEPEVGSVTGQIDIAIPTYNESRDVLEPTFLGAIKVRGNTTVWVLDDGERQWVRELAESMGIRYITRTDHSGAKAGNINNALPSFTGEYLLILDADHVPVPEIVERMLGHFTDPYVAVVQSPHGFRNLDSAQHYSKSINEQSLFFDVLLPGRGRTDAVFWCGSGAILRLTALRSVGGIATTTITEDLETSLMLQRAGWKLVYHNEVLLHGLAPHNLAAFLIQRYRWARGTIEILLGKLSPIFGPGFTMKTRLSYLSNLVYYLVPLQHLTFVVVIVCALLTAQLPANFSDPRIIVLWLVQLSVTLFSIWGISEGRQIPFTGSRNAWITGSVYIRAIVATLVRSKASFAVTPKEGVETGGWDSIRMLWFPIAAGFALSMALVARAVDLALGAHGFLPELSVTASLYLGVFAVAELLVVVPLVVSIVNRRQYRAVWRFPTDLQGRLDGFACRVIDLHESGVGIIVGDRKFASPTDINSMTLNVVLTDERGDSTIVKGEVIPVRPPTKLSSGEWKIAGRIVTWASDADRQRVLEYCYVATPGMEESK
jgi:cellulose synthase (UDP-forming)